MAVRNQAPVALITGAARGIGEGLARVLVARGYHVSLVGLEFQKLRSLAAELNQPGQPERAVAYKADVTDSKALERAVAQTINEFGRINVLVVNAGIANNGSFASTHVEDLARVVNVNLIGAVRTMKAAYEALLLTRGYVLFISSASAFPALPGITAYGASKAGVDHLANNLRLELRTSGVDVGVAYPSWIDTDLVRDQAEELPYFRKALAAEPMFFGKVTSLVDCVDRLVEGIELRSRRIYIPEWVGLMHLLRTATVSKVWDFAVGFFSGRMLPEMSQEARDLGRSFGKTSVETTRPAVDDAP